MRFFPFGALAAALVFLSGCVTAPPVDVLRAWDGCDLQAYGCYESCRLERGSRRFQCEQSCDRDADFCFNRVAQNAERRFGYTVYSDYTFFGRSGYWSPRFGFFSGYHGRDFSYRPNQRYRDPFFDPRFDYVYDCFGLRRAWWCDDYWRDQRRRYDRDRRRPLPQPDPRPTPQPNPPAVKAEPADDRPSRNRPNPPSRVVVPERPPATKSEDDVDDQPSFEPLIPARRPPNVDPVRRETPPSRTAPPVRRDEPAPVRRTPPPQRTKPAPQPRPVRPVQPPQRTEPAPRPRPQPQEPVPVRRQPPPEPRPARPAPNRNPEPARQPNEEER